MRKEWAISSTRKLTRVFKNGFKFRGVGAALKGVLIRTAPSKQSIRE